jgi:hypothetical protein
MTEAETHKPRLFISYSWSNPDHQAWVLSFAEELVGAGIDVILDKWDLQPGHDAHAFMESMVTDPKVNKVLLICDEVYARKSDARAGGAGTEAQIITPEIYAKKAQDKFVAVVRERDRDGAPYLPVYYKGRIYIDLSNAASYSTEFERLVRWAWDAPLNVRPPVGERPSFLSEEAATPRIASSLLFRRANEAIRSGDSNGVAAAKEYFQVISRDLEAFRIAMNKDNKDTFDDLVISNIDEFTHYRNELITVFTNIANYNTSEEMLEAVHRFFERLLPYQYRPESVHSSYDVDFDNFNFIVHELFLYCLGIFIQNEQFEAANHLIENEYYLRNIVNPESSMRSYLSFQNPMKILDFRNRRLKLNRLSLRADMLKERNKSTGIDFSCVMTADFILYIRSQSSSNAWHMWWPETLLYSDRYGAAFEIFARAKSGKYFERIKPLLGVKDKEELGAILTKIKSDRDRIPRWQFESISPDRLMGFDALATTV